MIVMPLGLLAILILWFQVLEGHDYYLISQMQVLVVVWAAFFYFLKEKRWWRHPAVMVALVAVFIVLANNGRHRHNARYSGWMNDGFKNHFEALTEIGPKFNQWGVEEEALVISLPDYSINASLYYMDRRGYTDFASDFTKEETFLKRIGQGATTMVINDTTILARPEVRKFATHFVGQYRNVKVFDLKPLRDSLQVSTGTH